MAAMDGRAEARNAGAGSPQPMKGGDIVKWGYTRTFSFEGASGDVTEVLHQAGCREVYTDDPSRNLEARVGFHHLLDVLSPKDQVVVTELGRLGRDAREVLEFLTAIRNAGAFLYVLDFSVWKEAQGERELALLNDVLLEICQYLVGMEEAWVARRQRKGIETARREGKYKGARKMFESDDPRLLEAIRLYETRQESGRTVSDIEQMTGINRRTLYRYLKDRRTKR